MNAIEYKKELVHHVVTSSKLADWIYHDVRLDCDDMARQRTAERLRMIEIQHGKDTLFGIAGWWAISSYNRLANAHEIAQIARRPELLPLNVSEIQESDRSDDRKRIYITAQQFISTMTHDNEETAKDIFEVAYGAGIDQMVSLMYAVLLLSIVTSNTAKRISHG